MVIELLKRVKHQKERYRAILVDFDGVLRRWPDSDSEIKKKYGLGSGSIRKMAFQPVVLDKAIRGLITDEQWRQNITDILQQAHPAMDVPSAITEWSESHGEVNVDLLALLSACKSNTEILLLTNATSRLNQDLAALELDNWFTKIINSSEVGSVKPESEIYKKAIQACSCPVSEIVYIDDSLGNATVGAEAGMLTHHYTNFDSCKLFLSEIGLPGN